jgi:hypothetical protein
MFCLIVRPRQRRFEIYKELLNDKSLYFRDVVFVAQPDPNSLSLPNIDPVPFLRLHQWLYHGNTKSIAQEIVPGHLQCGRIGIREMIDVHLVAYKLMIASLGNLAMELLGNGYYRSDLYPTMEEIELAYSMTPPASALRAYMLRQFQYMIFTSTISPCRDKLYGLSVNMR